MPTPRERELMGMDLNELLEALSSPLPGTPNHELTKMLIQARIAEMQRETTRDTLHWMRLSSVGVLASALVAVVALLIAVL